MTDVRDFSEVMERAKRRVGDRTEFLPYALFEETSSQYVNLAAWICSFPLSLTEDLAIRLLDFASERLSRQSDTVSVLGDMAPMFVDILRSSNLAISGSDGRWRYEQEARNYFLTHPRMGKSFAKEIHKWLLDYYRRHPPPSQTKREKWTQRIRAAYHQTPLEPKEGVQKYTRLFETYGEPGFRERVSLLIQEQFEWVDAYSVAVLFFQGMTNYTTGLFEEAKGFFEQIHNCEPLLLEVRSETSENEVRDQITGSPRRYEYIAVARHLLGNIVEHEPEPRRDEALIEQLYRDSLYVGTVLEKERHVAHVEHSLGDLLAQRSEPESLAEAENLLRRSLQYYEQDAKHIPSVELSLGLLLTKAGPDRYEEAIKRFTRGLKEEPYDYLKIRLQLGLGRVLVKRGRDDWAIAREAFSQALNVSRESGDTYREIEALRELLYLAEQEGDQAAQLLLEEQISEAYSRRGTELTRSEDLEEAADAYLECLRLSEERRDTQGVADAHVELGNLYLEQGKAELAREAFERARSVKHDDRTGAEALLGLGQALNGTQRWEEAEARLRQGLTSFSALKDQEGVAKCNAHLGKAYLGLSKPGAALRRLTAAHQWFEVQKQRYGAAKVVVSIAQVYDSLHHYSEALAYARQGLETLLKLGHKDAFAVEPFVNSLRSKVARVELLIAALHDGDESVRRRAAEELVELRDTRAVEPLIAALEDSAPWVRGSMARALRRFDTQEARAAVREYEAQKKR